MNALSARPSSFIFPSRRFAPVEKEHESRLRRGHGRILVMDDVEGIRSTTERMLTLIGYEVATAANGAEAWSVFAAAIQQHPPFDGAILDLTIRGGPGGMETLRRLREIDPDVAAIVASIFSRPGHCELRGPWLQGLCGKALFD